MGHAARTPVMERLIRQSRSRRFSRFLRTEIKSTELSSRRSIETARAARVEHTIIPPASSGRQRFTEITIVDPAARLPLYAQLRDYDCHADGAASAFQLDSEWDIHVAARSSANGRQANSVSLGTQTINNVPAAGTQVTLTIPAGTAGNAQAITIIRTIWTSTALQIPVEIKSSDPRSGTTDMELINIQQAEPDPSHFTVPAGYTVKTASAGAAAAGR